MASRPHPSTQRASIRSTEPAPIQTAGAWCNGEVAYLAWQVEHKIKDWLGFMVTRVHETGEDAGQRRLLPTWIAFVDQSNPQWIEQDSSVWPIQSFEWRDLTLRKSRNTTNVRPIDFKVHYEITPVGLGGPGRQPVPPSATANATDATGKPAYTGTPRPLFVLGPATRTNTIDVTHTYPTPGGAIAATFTNGILSTQNLVRQLESLHLPVSAPASSSGDEARPREKHLLAILKAEIVNEASPIRSFLTGDVFSFLTSLLDRAVSENGEVYLALYELHDPGLIRVLKQTAAQGRTHLILSTAGNTDPNPRNTPKDQRQPVVWDVVNDPVRAELHAIPQCDIQDRMFNSSGPIGHNKFAVYVKGGKAKAVLTGSTNWTETGLCTQSNNAILINDAAVAHLYWQYWQRLKSDVQPPREPLVATVGKRTIKGAKGNSATQGAELRARNARSFGPVRLDGGTTGVELWCSPNTHSGKKDKTSPMPGDLNDVYGLMDHAKRAIFFLTFMPGESGNQNIIGEAAKLARDRSDLLVMGAISDPKALPSYVHLKPGTPNPDVFTKPDGSQGKLPPRAILVAGGRRQPDRHDPRRCRRHSYRRSPARAAQRRARHYS